MTLKHEINNLSNADKLIEYHKDNKDDYLCLFSKDHNDLKKKLLITNNSVSSMTIYSKSESVLPIDEYSDATYLLKHHC